MRVLRISLVVALCSLSILAQNPPREWIDPDTGHRVVRLTDEPGSQSLYFHQTHIRRRETRWFLRARPAYIAYNFKTGKAELLVEGRVGSLVVDQNTPGVLFQRRFCFRNQSRYP